MHSDLESVLSRHSEFGDSSEIISRAQASLRQHLDDVAERVPAARRLAKVLDSSDEWVVRDTCTDTLIRCAVDHSRAQLNRPTRRGLGLDECVALFDKAADHLYTQHRWTPQACRGHLEDRFVYGRRGWVWSPDVGDPAFERAFHKLIDREYGHRLHSTDATEVAALRRGQAVLRKLLPRLSAGTLSHVATIALFAPLERARQSTSSSQFRLVGTIFFGRGVLADPSQVCELLLHESLHQKLYDLRHTHQLFRPAHEIERPALISPPWTSSGANGAQYWNVFRAFAAFHVYVHLTLLGRRVAESADGSADPSESHLTSASTAIERARYLGENIEQQGWHELGAAGHRFHAWLTSVLDALESERVKTA
jgi:hypothetical protein